MALVGRCGGFKPDGTPCQSIVKPPSTVCFAHDDARREERSRNARKAGRSRPNTELAEVKGLLRELTDAVLSGDVKVGTATAANQLLNTRLRAVELERRTNDLNTLLERLDLLERRADQLRGA